MHSKFITATIAGTSPLLCNRYTTTHPTPATSVPDQTAWHDAARKLYLDARHRPIIPQHNLFRCLVDAGRFVHCGSPPLTTRRGSVVPSCITLQATDIPIEHQEPWTVDSRPVRRRGTRERILCHRPCFKDWRLTFTLSYDAELISADLVRELVDTAGQRIGLGDFRPERGGPFGRFIVTAWCSANTTDAA